MKIVIFNGSHKLPTFVSNLVDALAEKHELIVLGFDDSIFHYSSKKKIRYFSLGSNNIKWKLMLSTFYLLINACIRKPATGYRFLWNWIMYSNKKETVRILNIQLALTYLQCDILHIQWASHLKSFAWFFDEKKRPKIIVSLRGRLVNVAPVCDKKLASFYSSYFPKVDAFHAVSQAIAKEATKYGANMENTKVVYSGLDLKKISKYKKENWKTNKPFKLLSIGRHHWKKGYHYALDGIRLLLDEGVDIHYTIVASGEVPQEILFQINDLKLSNNVSLIKGLPQGEVFRYMQTSDALLLPSVEEGIANVVLEAMAIGLPIISSNCGGMEEVIKDKKTGYMFELRNVQQMAEAIERAIFTNEKTKKEIAAQVQKYVSQKHGLSNMAESFDSIISGW